MSERERTHEANELLRKLNREAFVNAIDIEQLPHAVGLVLDYRQAAIQAERERCAKMVADAFSGVGGQAVANKILNICDNSNPTYKTRIEQVKSIVTNWREAIADAIRRGGEHEHNE